MPTIQKATIRNRAAPGFAALAMLLGACAASPPAALQEVGGRAIVIGPEASFDPATATDPWWRSSSRANGRFSIVDLGGTRVLRVHAPESGQATDAVLGRRLAI